MFKALIAIRDDGYEGKSYDHYTFGKPGDDLNGGFYVKRAEARVKGPNALDIMIAEFDEEDGYTELLIGEELIEKVRE